MSDYTPTTEVIRHAVAFPRERLGEPRPIKPEAFDRWLANAVLLARPLPTRDEIAEVIEAEILDFFDWPGIHPDLPFTAADAVLALLKGQET